MKKTSKSKAPKNYLKVCNDCGCQYSTPQLHSQFCDECKKRRAVAATLKNRNKKRELKAEMDNLGTAQDQYRDIHLKVMRAVSMMEAGHAVVKALRNWMGSMILPDSAHTQEWKLLMNMLECYSQMERGLAK